MVTREALPVPVPVRPALESGDHLTRDEFHRRYLQRPDIHKAELVGGVVYVASPTRGRQHGKPHLLLSKWIADYIGNHPAIEGVSDSSLLLSEQDELKPDLMMWRKEGEAGFNDEGYVEGAPELVVEISASSASYDLFEKKEAYRKAGVQEYIVWQTEDRRLDWFRLENGQYVQLVPDEDGVTRSRVFEGLALDIAALLAGKFPA